MHNDTLSHELMQFLSYWSALGGGQTIPDRERLDLRNLSSAVRWSFILEMGMDGALQFSLAGPSLEEALGCQMSGHNYSDILAFKDGNFPAEELYAQCLVKGCGLLRIGRFSSADGASVLTQILALPFADPRPLGGTVMVGLVSPFDAPNHKNQDRREHLTHQVSSLVAVPSPRVVTIGQLSKGLRDSLSVHGLQLTALDTDAFLRASLPGHSIDYGDYAALDPDQVEDQFAGALN